jgi:hypothetical protein
MGERVEGTLWELLAEVPDQRSPLGCRFSLRSILALTLGAVLSGRKSLAAVARWGRGLKRRQLEQLGVERSRAPCQATYHNLFKGLEVEALEEVLGRWVGGLLGKEPPGQLALDGKKLRGSRSQDYPGLYLLAAYSEAVQGVMAEVEVAEETNEISAALKLLKEIPLPGAVLTGDAIFAQKEICQEVMAGKGEYFFLVKANQQSLEESIAAAFAPPVSPLGGAPLAGRGRGGPQPGEGPRAPGGALAGSH